MGHGFKALALIVLLAVGAAERRPPPCIDFDMTTVHGFYMGSIGPCIPGPCQDAFFADTGLPESLGSYSGSATMIVDDAGLGSITIAIGTWTGFFGARMNFLEPRSSIDRHQDRFWFRFFLTCAVLLFHRPTPFRGSQARPRISPHACQMGLDWTAIYGQEAGRL